MGQVRLKRLYTSGCFRSLSIIQAQLSGDQQRCSVQLIAIFTRSNWYIVGGLVA